MVAFNVNDVNSVDLNKTNLNDASDSNYNPDTASPEDSLKHFMSDWAQNFVKTLNEKEAAATKQFIDDNNGTNSVA